MATTNSRASNETVASSGDYIDIIDVFGLLWRAKFYVIIGLFFGAISGLIVSQTKKPPVYVTSLPVSLEGTGGLTIEQSLARLNELTGSADVQKKLQAAGLVVSAGKLPVSLRGDASKLTLEVLALNPDPTGEVAFKTAMVLSDAARDHNSRSFGGSSLSGEPRIAKSELEINYAKVASAQVMEEAPLKAQLFALESKLAKKSGLAPSVAMGARGTSLGDDVPRLLGALEGKLSLSEQQKIITDYATLVGKIKSVQAKYEQSISEMAAAISAQSAGVVKSSIGIGDNYPVLVVDESSYKASVAAGAHARYESKRDLFVLMGGIFGGLLALMAYGAILFFRDNRVRLKAVFQA